MSPNLCDSVFWENFAFHLAGSFNTKINKEKGPDVSVRAFVLGSSLPQVVMNAGKMGMMPPWMDIKPPPIHHGNSEANVSLEESASPAMKSTAATLDDWLSVDLRTHLQNK